ncbi:MAG: DNA polymerase III subunit alpha [Bacteroidetes bacterium]|nr:DNA polymerase III subunit alpha [Bacteroidota bacterium]
MSKFTHIHVHTQYSILDGASNIPKLIARTKELGMDALAITDHGNMFGVKEFYDEALKQKIKPLLGIETYVARNSRTEQKTKKDRSGEHLIIIAKNIKGYKNLIKLSSFAYTEGFYYKPRIDKELLEKYHEGLIVSSACLGGEIPQLIMDNRIDDASKTIEWFKNLFGEDYYLELMLHKSDNIDKNKDIYDKQVIVNKTIIELAKKHNVKIIATNDCHFIKAEDAEAHDRLICLNTGQDFDDPTRMRYTKQEYLKSPEQMAEIFSDVPEALSNTQEIVDKVEVYELNYKPIMPDFPLPEGFDNEDVYLEHLTYEGAKERYPEITEEIKERIDFELSTIKRMGFPGYFLIVWDFIRAARELDVVVGPGRGSAAGSVVAYCTKITQIDPLKYDLLFERFLNPDRISMPDIDIDFDDDGREKILKWVVNKYGYKRVSHIITFGTMAAKMAIRDVARVQKLPLSESDKLAKLVPDTPKITLKKAYKEVPELEKAKKSDNELIASTLKYAEELEGSIRHTGTHACGIIIGKDDLIEHIPMCTLKDSDLLVTQYDGRFVEPVGMLKMDFLGLKTLSIIKDAIENIKLSRNLDVDIDNISLDDKPTFDLYSSGNTTGTFQFESPGMKKHLRNLKPNKFEDLIAMNALYRPGPMEYIPSFINRKLGKEKIDYNLPEMEEYLKDTYGITVYQEQVMLLSRKLAGFTRGQADSLRKAMGKKKKTMMDELKVKFDEGCKNNGFENKITDKIWKDWESFAQYAFNKSHSTCYAYIAYQTAYLKANYAAEYMAAVLSRNITDIKKITIYMDECKRMGLDVLPPDVNESYFKFTVNKKGNIRFGIGAVKGVGKGAVKNIIKERNNEGDFQNIFNFAERVDLHCVSKKTLEALAFSGALDSFSELKREQYFATDNKDTSFIETLIKYGNCVKNEKNSTQQSLFDGTGHNDVSHPQIPVSAEWKKLDKLNKEKEYIGIYLTAHPLDDFKFEINNFCNHNLSDLVDISKLAGKEISIAGIVTDVRHSTTKTGKPYGAITIADYTDSYTIMMFSKDYLNFKQFFTLGYSLFVKGIVQKRKWGNEDLEFKIKSIDMLADMKEQMLKSISLKIKISDLSNNLINEMLDLAEKNKGNVILNFLIYNPLDKTWIQMFSRNKKINLNNEFLKYLKENQNIEFKLN